ncbi:hypothetical protein PoB_001875500 [Plakobranchus ocellatus]|uniref:Uncharacterized protein n=1 Tax=Plakobranchus ocellatus TaxID=259542 RepID=A0AAV3ZAS6_9GAST|nr:hypothetical protein PoB_001875500 [Plakobranchus ocellatus]
MPHDYVFRNSMGAGNGFSHAQSSTKSNSISYSSREDDCQSVHNQPADSMHPHLPSLAPHHSHHHLQSYHSSQNKQLQELNTLSKEQQCAEKNRLHEKFIYATQGPPLQKPYRNGTMSNISASTLNTSSNAACVVDNKQVKPWQFVYKGKQSNELEQQQAAAPSNISSQGLQSSSSAGELSTYCIINLNEKKIGVQ